MLNKKIRVTLRTGNIRVVNIVAERYFRNASLAENATGRLNRIKGQRQCT